MITIPTLTKSVRFEVAWHVISYRNYARPADVRDTGKSLAAQYTIYGIETHGHRD
jgi:hypothetical protein